MENILAFLRFRNLYIHTAPEPTFLDHSGLSPLKRVFTEENSGTFVLCAVHGAGKTSAIKHLAKHRITVCVRCPKKSLSLAWFNESILGSTHRTQEFSEHARNANLWNTRFVTLVLADFDQPMSEDKTSALQFISDLHADSTQAMTFNVLVECVNPSNAHAVLDRLRGEGRAIPLEWVHADAVRLVNACGPSSAAQDLTRHGNVAKTKRILQNPELGAGSIRQIIFDRGDEAAFDKIRETLEVFR